MECKWLGVCIIVSFILCCRGFPVGPFPASHLQPSRSRLAYSSVGSPEGVHLPVTEIWPAETPEDFSSLVGGETGKEVVAVWFHAQWCRKCKYIGARLRHLEEHLPPRLTDQLAVRVGEGLRRDLGRSNPT
ncbi:unnamed protein product [Discosporangium mesarthrocarpum]